MFVKEQHFEIELSDGKGKSIPAALECEARHWNECGFSHRVCRITLRYEAEEIDCTDRDFFEAFCRVREHLEKVGLYPLCYAASQNVFPSGMCRDMGDGLRAYRLKIGSRVGEGDLVSIFDSGPEIEPASVKAQREFFESWLESSKP
jgi:hypothetical protein